MKKVKTLSVFGTRPEAIKMAPLVKALEKNPRIESKVCVTAQHREMLDQVLDIFHIQPDHDLDVMKDRQTLASITTGVLQGMVDTIEMLRPDIVLVHGDTTTTFSAALAAFYTKTRVGHVEAGLRTYDKFSPYPEEMNRILTGHIADLHFAPTQRNVDNLKKEGIFENIFLTGNTVIDAIGYTVKEDYIFHEDRLNGIDFEGNKVVLVTAHRRENLGEGLENISRAVVSLVEKHPDVEVIYPVHLNPAVQNTVRSIMDGRDRIHLIDPLDVDDMHNLMNRCYMVMTDSGGLQEEAPHLGKPVVVLRNETERPEAVEAGTVVVTGIDEKAIFTMGSRLLEEKNFYETMAKAVNPYGDGEASRRIVEAILYTYGLGEKPEPFRV